MQGAMIYFGSGILFYIIAKSLPRVFGRTTDLFECVGIEPLIGIPAMLLWPATILFGCFLQLCSLQPSVADDERGRRELAECAPDEVVISLPQGPTEKVLGYARCVTDLRPTGKVEFNGVLVQATTLSQHVACGEMVAVVEQRENEVVVSIISRTD